MLPGALDDDHIGCELAELLPGGAALAQPESQGAIEEQVAGLATRRMDRRRRGDKPQLCGSAGRHDAASVRRVAIDAGSRRSIVRKEPAAEAIYAGATCRAPTADSSARLAEAFAD